MEHRLGNAGCALWTYWSSLRQGDIVPFRRDFDPMAIARYLPVASLIEQEAPEAWRIRLVGTEIARRSGELAGRNYLDLVAPEQRQAQVRHLHELIARPCGSVGMRTNVRQGGWSYLVRSVSLPLRANDGAIRLVIGTNEEISHDPNAPSDRLGELRIGERQFLDIGAGIPATLAA